MENKEYIMPALNSSSHVSEAYKKLSLAAIFIIDIALTMAIIFSLISVVRSGPSSVAVRYAASRLTDTKAAASLLAYDYEDYMQAVYGGEALFFEKVSGAFGIYIDSWDDYYEAVDEKSDESLECEYGEYKITAKATDSKNISVNKALKSWRSFIDSLEHHTDFERGRITGAKLVTVKLKRIGKYKTVCEELCLCIINTGNGWKVLEQPFAA